MAKRFNARKAKEVHAFLVENSFCFAGDDGDDDIYTRNGYTFTVKVAHRKNEEIPTGTMLYINKSITQCGFPDKYILIWWKENGYGE